MIFYISSGKGMNQEIAHLSKPAFILALQLTNNREDANDILQDTFYTLLSHKNAPARHTAEFKPWFYKVIRNKAIDLLRKKSHQAHDPIETVQLPVPIKHQPEQIFEHNETHSQLNNALKKLSLEQREIIYLHDYHDFSYAELSDILDVAPGTVMSRLHRARLALKDAFFNTTKKES